MGQCLRVSRQPPVDAGCIERFGNDNLDESRKLWRESPPDPLCNNLTCGIAETLHLVEIAVIQFQEKRREGVVNVGEVSNPARPPTDGASDVDLYAEGVAMEPSTWMAVRDVRKSMCSIHAEGSVDIHRLSRMLLPHQRLWYWGKQRQSPSWTGEATSASDPVQVSLPRQPGLQRVSSTGLAWVGQHRTMAPKSLAVHGCRAPVRHICGRRPTSPLFIRSPRQCRESERFGPKAVLLPTRTCRRPRVGR